MPHERYLLPPAAGKRLIARGLAASAPIKEALASHTLVIIAGTTNGCVARELLGPDFSSEDFFRGSLGPATERGPFPGDVVLRKGAWEQGKEIFDVIESLGPGDVILKGANALDYPSRQAAVLIADPRGGTILCALEAVIGRRTELIVPVGLEKRVYGDLSASARQVNAPGETGWRLFPLPGRVYTEIEALHTLAGVTAHLIAAGGINGFEGAVLLRAEGSPEELARARKHVDDCGGQAIG